MLRGRVRVKSWREPAAAEIQGLGNAADVKLLWEGMAGVTTHRHSLLRFSEKKGKLSLHGKQYKKKVGSVWWHYFN